LRSKNVDSSNKPLRFYTDPNGNTTEYRYFSGGPSLPMPGFDPAFGIQPHEFVREVREPVPADNVNAPGWSPEPEETQPVVTGFTYNIGAQTRIVRDPRHPQVPDSTYHVNLYGATTMIEEPLGKTTTMVWATPDTPQPGPVPGNGIDVVLVSKPTPWDGKHLTHTTTWATC